MCRRERVSGCGIVVVGSKRQRSGAAEEGEEKDGEKATGVRWLVG